MLTIRELKQQIRFAISQISSSNAHHEFEDISYEIAKRRICSNILPATGPVSSGGDQGKDFESFRSYIQRSLIDSGFVGLVSNKYLVFACSVNQQFMRKIKKDIKTICEGPRKVDQIHYFYGQDIPVGKRHELQNWAQTSYSLHLEIYDAKAIADFLTEEDLFWIASQFLSIPQESYPVMEVTRKSWYQELRTKWIEQKNAPYSYADFIELKRCVRSATINDRRKQDIQAWINILKTLKCQTSSEALKRAAFYEIAVASLRGLGSMQGLEEELRTYFKEIGNLVNSSDIENTAVLLTYCSGAVASNVVVLNESETNAWRNELSQKIEQLLDASKNPGYKCMLLETLGSLRLDPTSFGNLEDDCSAMFDVWEKLLVIVDDAPLFPLEHFSDRLTHLVDIIGEHPRYFVFTKQVDQHLSSRFGAYIAAEKSRDRAIAFYEQGKILRAIKELHEAKATWFTSETIKGSILAMILLSQWYERLRLTWASKYYALAAAYTAVNVPQDDIKKYIPQALTFAAEAGYLGGLWWDSIQLTELALKTHGQFASDPYNFDKHHELQHLFFNITMLAYVTSRLDQDLYKVIDAKIQKWGDAHDIIDELLKDVSKEWQSFTDDQLWLRMEEQGATAKPYSDLGSQFVANWSALGISWTVEWENCYETTTLVEQFLSVLQIVCSDLADVDLYLMRSSVHIDVTISDDEKLQLEPVSNNKVREWRLKLPKNPAQNEDDSHSYNVEVLVSAIRMLSDDSLLPDEELNAIVMRHLEGGIFHKAFFTDPYHKLFKEFASVKQFEEKQGLQFNLSNRPFAAQPSSELMWHDQLLPTYSQEASFKLIDNRYKKTIPPIRLTLPHLIQDPDFMMIVDKLKAEGWKEWHLLLAVGNIVMNERTQQLMSGRQFDPLHMRLAMQSVGTKEEAPEDIQLAPAFFTEERLRDALTLSQGSTLKILGLVIKQQTPILESITDFLANRYNYWTDDTEHISVFQFTQSEPEAEKL